MAKKTLNPVYGAKEATFTFPIYLSLADKLGVLELVAWDKDMLKKDYLGETSLQLEDWFKDRPIKDFEDPRNSVSIISIIGRPTCFANLVVYRHSRYR